MLEQEKRRPWRRWIVLVLMIAGFILGGIFVPVQPEIAVAAEKLIEEPIFENFLGFVHLGCMLILLRRYF